MPYLSLRIPLFFGFLVFKPAKWRLFSERYGYSQNIVIGNLSITWRKYRKITHSNVDNTEVAK